jgi:hypothetical protein
MGPMQGTHADGPVGVLPRSPHIIRRTASSDRAYATRLSHRAGEALSVYLSLVITLDLPLSSVRNVSGPASAA